MAGAAGHIESPWEVSDLTFGEIKDLIENALDGKLENVSEKLDGANMLVTYRLGSVHVARSPKQLRNKGKESIPCQIIDTFMNTEEAKHAYSESSNDLNKLFSRIDMNPNEIFNEGEKWLNIELLTPDMENIIHYGKKQLRIHNIWTVDDDGKILNVSDEGELDRLVYAMDRVEKSDLLYEVSKTNKVRIIPIMDGTKETLLSYLKDLMNTCILTDKDTISDYFAIAFYNRIIFHNEMIFKEKAIDAELSNNLIKRWAYNDKTQNITKILKGKTDEIISWVKDQDKDVDEMKDYLLQPIVEIFSKLGVKVLQNLSGISCSDPDTSIKIIREKAEYAFQKTNQFILRGEDQKKINILSAQMMRFKQAGGLETIVPVEGIVFEFNNRILKLTGSFLPILKMVGFFRFGRYKN